MEFYEKKKERKKIKKYEPTIFVHPKADPREPREYSISKKEEENFKKGSCIIL